MDNTQLNTIMQALDLLTRELRNVKQSIHKVEANTLELREDHKNILHELSELVTTLRIDIEGDDSDEQTY